MRATRGRIASSIGGGVPRSDNIFNPPGALAGWRQSKTQIGSAPIWISVIGDSVACGFQAPTPGAGWFDVLRATLLQSYPLMGDFWFARHDDTATQRNLSPAPWATNQTPLVDTGGIGAWLETWNSQTGVMPLKTLTAPYAYTDADVLWYDLATGGNHFQYSVDGGAAVNINTGFTSRPQRTAISGLANTTHVLRLGGQTADGVMHVPGVCTYPSAGARTAGLGFGLAAVSGIAIGSWGRQSWPGGDKPAMWGGFDGTTWGAFGFPTMPHLAIIALGLNDSGQVITGGQQNAYAFAPSGVGIMLDRFIRALRRGRPNVGIIILAYCNPTPTNSDLTSGNFAGSTNWPKYLRTYQRVAAAHNVALINMDTQWGLTPVARGFITAGNAHPNNAGHADIAATVLSIL